jgi:hypothetical protein
MSLEIDVEKISEVLLVDGWHKVNAVGDGRSSFGLDAYEFRELTAQENPTAQEKKVEQAEEGKREATTPGARWTESDGSRVFCPVTSILAVKYAGQQKNPQ